MSARIKLLVVDDHALVRDVLADRLEREPDIKVVGTASTADEAIRMTSKHKPDIILMDIDMPGLDCFDAAKVIMSAQPQTRIIFLSAFHHDCYIENALTVKARGYLTKREPPESLISAIHEVASGGACFSEEVQARIVVDSRGAKLAAKKTTRASMLTPRENEILRYVARSLSKKEIARITNLSVKTVDRHCANLMGKLDIHDRVELTRFAIREGMADA